MSEGRATGRDRGLTPLFFLLPLALYVATVAPSLGFGDTAILVNHIHHLELSSHVNNHNVTTVVGWLFARLLPFESLPFKANLASAATAGLAVGLFALAVRAATGSALVALLSSLAFAVSWSLWWSATIAENCAANVLLLAASVLALRRGRTKTAAFLAGFAVFNHVQMGLWCAGLSLGLAVEAARRGRAGWRFFAAGFGSLLLGLVPWLVLLAISTARGGALGPALEDAFFGGFSGMMLKETWYAAVTDTARITLMQAPSPYLPLLLAGPWVFFRGGAPALEKVATGALFVGNTLFFMLYHTWDRFTFLLPSFLLLFLWSAEALALLAARRPARIRPGWWRGLGALFALSTLALPPLIFTNLTRWGDPPGVHLLGDFRDYDTAHLYRRREYVVNPVKRGFTDIEEFAELVFAKLPPEAILIDDDSRTAANFLYYYQPLLKRRPDLTVVMSSGLAIPGWGDTPEGIYKILLWARDHGRPLFIVSIQYPHKLYLDLRRAEDGIAFEKFPLDDRRWIFRMVTAAPR